MSDDARDLYRVPDLRSCPHLAAKWCELCNKWTNHFSDGHDDDELASDTEAKTALQQAREKLGKA